MQLKVETKNEEAEFIIYRTDFHEIKMKLDENEETAASKFKSKISTKKISEEEKENEITLWVQKKAKLRTTKPIDPDFWIASIEALREEIMGMTHEEAIKEAKKQTTLDQYRTEEEA